MGEPEEGGVEGKSVKQCRLKGTRAGVKQHIQRWRKKAVFFDQWKMGGTAKGLGGSMNPRKEQDGWAVVTKGKRLKRKAAEGASELEGGKKGRGRQKIMLAIGKMKTKKNLGKNQGGGRKKKRYVEE